MRRVVDFLWRPALSPMFVFLWCTGIAVWNAWGFFAWLAWAAATFAVEIFMTLRMERAQ